jgi:hypothetical protein
MLLAQYKIKFDRPPRLKDFLKLNFSSRNASLQTEGQTQKKKWRPYRKNTLTLSAKAGFHNGRVNVNLQKKLKVVRNIHAYVKKKTYYNILYVNLLFTTTVCFNSNGWRFSFRTLIAFFFL